MAFQGDVAQIPISNIVQALFLNGQEGVLSVESRQLKCKVRVLKFGIRPLSTQPENPEPLRIAVVKGGLLTASEFQNAISAWDPPTKFPGDFLVRRRVLTKEQVENEIRKQFEETIYEILTARELRYTFLAGEDCLDYELFHPDKLGTTLIYNVNALLMEAARRDDEWRRIEEVIPSTEEILVPTNKRLSPGLDTELNLPPAAYKELANLVTGDRTVERVVSDSTLSRYEACHALFLLKSKGHVRPLSVKEKEELADKLRRLNKTRRAIDVYRSILAADPDNARSREMLVSLLEKGKYQTSFLAEEYLTLVESLKREDPKKALEYLEKVLQIDAGNFEAHRSVFRLQAAGGNRSRALVAARDLIRTAKSAESQRQVGEFLREVLRQYPDEIQLYHEAAELFINAGETQDAVECLKAAAGFYQKRNDLQKLLKTYEYIAKINPAESGHLRKISANYRRTRVSLRRCLKTVGITILCALLLAGVSYLTFREYVSRIVFAEMKTAVDVHNRYHAYERALTALQDFMDEYPFSTHRPKVTQLISQTKQAEHRHQQEVQTDKRNLDNELLQVITTSSRLNTQGRLAEAERFLNQRLRRFSSIQLDQEQTERLERIRRLHGEVRSFLTTKEHLESEAKEAAKLADKSRFSQIHSKLKSLFTGYRPAASSATLPVLLLSTPQADVELDGRRYRTPTAQWFPPYEQVKVVIQQSGFKSVARDFVPHETAVVEAVLPKDGQHFPTGHPVDAYPLWWNDNVYFPNRNGEVFSVSPDLEWRWKRRVAKVEALGDVTGGLGGWTNVVYAGCFDGHVYLLDAETGERRSSIPCSLESTRTAIKEPPSLPSRKGTIVLNLSGRQLVGVSLGARRVIWRYPPVPKQKADFVGRPLAHAGRISTFTRGGDWIVLDHDSGQLVREQRLGGRLSHPGRVRDGQMFVALSSGGIKAFAASSGKVLWEAELSSPPTASPTVVPELQAILVPLGSEELACHDARSGREKWVKPAGLIAADGVTRGDRFYVGTLDGRILCWDIRSAGICWEFRTVGADEVPPRGITSRGMIHGGTLYQGCEDGNLYRLALE